VTPRAPDFSRSIDADKTKCAGCQGEHGCIGARESPAFTDCFESIVSDKIDAHRAPSDKKEAKEIPPLAGYSNEAQDEEEEMEDVDEIASPATFPVHQGQALSGM
jgi:hypothetical protein